jgi:hypothetical protein
VEIPKLRTEAQKQALDRAWVRAMEVRTENASLKSKEAEIEKVQSAKTASLQAEKINSDYAAIKESEPKTPHVSPEQKQKKRKQARRVIVTEVSSASEPENVETVMPRPKLPKPPTAPNASAAKCERC